MERHEGCARHGARDLADAVDNAGFSRRRLTESWRLRAKNAKKG